MQNSRLSAIATFLILLILLFALVTHRLMLGWKNLMAGNNLHSSTTSLSLQNLSALLEMASIGNTSRFSLRKAIHKDVESNILSRSKALHSDVKHFDSAQASINPGDSIKQSFIDSAMKNESVIPINEQKVPENKNLKKILSSKRKNKEALMDLNYASPLYQRSPRNGTDISAPHRLSILKCINQSSCIIPKLQLARKFKIYFCKHTVHSGVRFFYLAREAFLLHPSAILLDFEHIHEADFIIYLPGSAPWHKSECANSSHARKMIVLDEFDGHQNYSPYGTTDEMIKHFPRYKKNGVWYFQYFKRSFVTRVNGTFFNYPHLSKMFVYPMTYSIAEAYVPHTFTFVRELDILCTLRGSRSQLTRLRVQQWVAEYAVDRKVENYISAEVNTASRTTVNRQYFEQMYNARIIVTVNPANWEGDFRLWESFATGALILVDPILVPHPFPLVDGEHVVYFSNSNKTDLWMKLDYYRANPLVARRIAEAGYLHAMKYHRAPSLADYVLRTAHLKRAQKRKARVPDYLYTGQYLSEEAERQINFIKSSQYPGDYSKGK